MTAIASGRRRRSAVNGPATGFWRSPLFGRRLFGAMLALAAIHAGWGGYWVIHGSRVYGAAYIGMSKNEVRYLFGPPDRELSDGRWRIADADHVMAFAFDAAGRVAMVGCTAAPDAEGAGCPDAFGIGIGSGEDVAWNTLGQPATETYRGDTKIIGYPALGLRYRLRRTTVVAIEHRRHGDGAAVLAAVVTTLAP